MRVRFYGSVSSAALLRPRDPGSLGRSLSVAVATSTTVVRGLAQAMHIIEGAESGTMWSRLTKSRHWTRKAFSRSKVLIPTHWRTGTNQPDTDWAASLKFACAILPGGADALTGLPARGLSYRFGGAKVGLYNGPGTNALGYLESDWLDHAPVSVGAFDLFTVVENQAGASSGSGTLPTNGNVSAYIARHEGGLTNHSGGGNAGVSFIDTNAAEAATTVTANTSAQTGSFGGFCPLALLIEYDAGDQVVVPIGDSINQGVGEGVTGSGTNADLPVYGDTRGDARGNRGYVERAVDLAGYHVGGNLSRGSNGYKFLGLADNCPKMMNVLARLNPTHVFLANVHNDASGSVTNVAFQTYAGAFFDLVQAAVPGVRMIQAVSTPDAACNVSVSSLAYATATGKATATVASTAAFVDGQKVTVGGSSQAGGGATTALNGEVTIQITSATQFTYTPLVAPTADVTATGTIAANAQYRTAASQTAGFGFGTSTSRRGQLNALIRAKSGPFARCSATYDMNPVVEEGYDGTAASETSKWKVSSRPWALVWDGTHPNSRGYDVIAQDLASKLPAMLGA